MLQELQNQNTRVVGIAVNFERYTYGNRITKYYPKETFISHPDDEEHLAAFDLETDQLNFQPAPFLEDADFDNTDRQAGTH